MWNGHNADHYVWSDAVQTKLKCFENRAREGSELSPLNRICRWPQCVPTGTLDPWASLVAVLAPGDGVRARTTRATGTDRRKFSSGNWLSWDPEK